MPQPASVPKPVFWAHERAEGKNSVWVPRNWGQCAGTRINPAVSFLIRIETIDYGRLADDTPNANFITVRFVGNKIPSK